VRSRSAHNPADADPAGFRQRFEARRDVDPVAVNVAPILYDVAEIDSHPEFDAAFGQHNDVSHGHLALHLNRATHRVDDAAKLDQQAVSGGFYDPAAVLLDLGVGQLASQRLQCSERAFLVHPHQTRIPRHIGGENCSKATDSWHVSPGGRFGLTNSSAKPAAALAARSAHVNIGFDSSPSRCGPVASRISAGRKVCIDDEARDAGGW